MFSEPTRVMLCNAIVFVNATRVVGLDGLCIMVLIFLSSGPTMVMECRYSGSYSPKTVKKMYHVDLWSSFYMGWDHYRAQEIPLKIHIFNQLLAMAWVLGVKPVENKLFPKILFM